MRGRGTAAALASAEASGRRSHPNPIRRPWQRCCRATRAAIAEQIAARLKLSNAERKRLVARAADPLGEQPSALAYRAGSREPSDDQLLLAGERDLAEVETDGVLGAAAPAAERRRAWSRAGCAKGPDVARALRAGRGSLDRRGFPAMGRVNALADEIVAQALLATSSEQASACGSGRA